MNPKRASTNINERLIANIMRTVVFLPHGHFPLPLGFAGNEQQKQFQKEKCNLRIN